MVYKQKFDPTRKITQPKEYFDDMGAALEYIFPGSSYNPETELIDVSGSQKWKDMIEKYHLSCEKKRDL